MVALDYQEIIAAQAEIITALRLRNVELRQQVESFRTQREHAKKRDDDEKTLMEM